MPPQYSFNPSAASSHGMVPAQPGYSNAAYSSSYYSAAPNDGIPPTHCPCCSNQEYSHSAYPQMGFGPGNGFNSDRTTQTVYHPIRTASFDSNHLYKQQKQQQPNGAVVTSFSHNPYATLVEDVPLVTNDSFLEYPKNNSGSTPQYYGSNNNIMANLNSGHLNYQNYYPNPMDTHQSEQYLVAPPREQKSNRVTDEQFENIIGNMKDLAKTPHGSSYIQACLRDGDDHRFQKICGEIIENAPELLIDPHGCYVVRSIMERMSLQDLKLLVEDLMGNHIDLIFKLSTGTLHSRRIIQFLLEACPTSYKILSDLMSHRCTEISRTQQGCIVMQRVLDMAPMEKKEEVFDIVKRNFASFAMDPYANYVVQYMFEVWDVASNSAVVRDYLMGSVVQLACDKYASNVIEKALHFTDHDAQHLIVSELYDGEKEKLVAMIQDNYGNYIIQSTIALCGLRDVMMIAERLKPVIHNTAYGYKIASKLERRLKGRF